MHKMLEKKLDQMTEAEYDREMIMLGFTKSVGYGRTLEQLNPDKDWMGIGYCNTICSNYDMFTKR